MSIFRIRYIWILFLLYTTYVDEWRRNLYLMTFVHSVCYIVKLTVNESGERGILALMFEKVCHRIHVYITHLSV